MHVHIYASFFHTINKISIFLKIFFSHFPQHVNFSFMYYNKIFPVNAFLYFKLFFVYITLTQVLHFIVNQYLYFSYTILFFFLHGTHSSCEKRSRVYIYSLNVFP